MKKLNPQEQKVARLDLKNSNEFVSSPKTAGFGNSHLVSSGQFEESEEKYTDLVEAYKMLNDSYTQLQIKHDSLQSKLVTSESSIGSRRSQKCNNQPTKLERNPVSMPTNISRHSNNSLEPEILDSNKQLNTSLNVSKSNINDSSIGRIRKNREKINNSFNLSYEDECSLKYGRKSFEKGMEVANQTSHIMSSVLKPKINVNFGELNVL